MSEARFAHLMRQHNVKSKNIPNYEEDGSEVAFADYYDPDTIPRDVDPSTDVERALYGPYEAYLAGVPEITVEREMPETDEEGRMFWCDVTIRLPNDDTRRELLARLVADAFRARMSL